MYVITGATGNIGSKLTATLLSRGQKVRAVARGADGLGTLAAKGAEVRAGDLKDTAFLTDAFRGATAVFTMIPPDYAAADFRAYQNAVGRSIAEAVMNAGVRSIVNLSSQGAHLPMGTGPIKGLHDQEQRLNALHGVRPFNIVHLRPAYFMENTLANIPMIRAMGINGSAIRGELAFPMIATQDIAVAAADLLTGGFTGRSVKDLLGQRDLSLTEATRIIGEKLGRPDLPYVQFSYEDAEKGMIGAGLGPDIARLFVEMSRAFNEGLIAPRRTTESTTATTFEEFAVYFASVYGVEATQEKTKVAA